MKGQEPKRVVVTLYLVLKHKLIEVEGEFKGGEMIRVQCR